MEKYSLIQKPSSRYCLYRTAEGGGWLYSAPVWNGPSAVWQRTVEVQSMCCSGKEGQRTALWGTKRLKAINCWAFICHFIFEGFFLSPPEHCTPGSKNTNIGDELNLKYSLFLIFKNRVFVFLICKLVYLL